jgi:DNA-binding transcriptional regulator YbjK
MKISINISGITAKHIAAFFTGITILIVTVRTGVIGSAIDGVRHFF